MNRLDSIRKRTTDAGFKVSQGITLTGGLIADLVASRTSFSWKGLVILSQHLVITRIENPTVSDFEKFFESSFQIGKSRNPVPLLRGLQFGYMIIPVILAKHLSDEVKQYVAQQPKKRWALFELPVVCREDTPETYYFKSTPLWGAFFFSDLREIIERCIEQPEPPPLPGSSLLR